MSDPFHPPIATDPSFWYTPPPQHIPQQHQLYHDLYAPSPLQHYAHPPPPPPAEAVTFHFGGPLESDHDHLDDGESVEETQAPDDNCQEDRQRNKKKKNKNTYPRHNFHKTEGRRRLKATEAALQRAAEGLETARSALREAERVHAACQTHHQQTSQEVVDELLESERPRPWNKLYLQLVDFFHRHGHLTLSVRASTAKKKLDKRKKRTKESAVGDSDIDVEEIGILGRWAAGQRNSRKRGKLEDWKIAALDRLGFVWDAREAAWQETYQELKQFHDQHGHINVMEKEYPSLNRWLRFQRDNYRDFQTNGSVEKRDDGVFGMNQERCDLLEALGMEWGGHDERWIVLFRKLKELHHVQGHLRTLPTTGKNSHKLREFATKQREAYRIYQQKGAHDCPEISAERVLLLESIQFPWTEDKNDDDPTSTQPEGDNPTTNSRISSHESGEEWMNDYKLIKAFFQKHHHFSYEHGDANESAAKHMRAWDRLQRQHYKDLNRKSKSRPCRNFEGNVLTPERIELLDGLGFFRPNGNGNSNSDDDEGWQQQMSHLRRFHSRHGHAMIMHQYPGNPAYQKLADWAIEQRKEYKIYHSDAPSKLTWDRIYQLSTLGFNFDLPPPPTVGTPLDPKDYSMEHNGIAKDGVESTRKRQAQSRTAARKRGKVDTTKKRSECNEYGKSVVGVDSMEASEAPTRAATEAAMERPRIVLTDTDVIAGSTAELRTSDADLATLGWTTAAQNLENTATVACGIELMSSETILDTLQAELAQHPDENFPVMCEKVTPLGHF